MASEAPTPTAGSASDRRSAIEALEGQLARTPRASKPYEHATLAYRLGLAYAESPVHAPSDGLRKALACYDVAAAVFDPRFEPDEHARVLNAAGAAHRGLGDRRKAAGLFGEAARLLEGRGRDQERAAVLNNLGLVHAELGESELAVEALDQAVELFDTSSAEGRRGRSATLHSRGMASAALGTEEGLEAALADYDLARSEIDPDDAPYHHALVHHSIGVTCTSLARLRPAERDRLLEEAIAAFEESLHIFTRAAFPFQHALAKHNLGLALSALGGVTNLRRALASFEDAVAVLDPRVQGDAWKHAYAQLERTEKELGELVPGLSRAGHFAALVAASRPDDRRQLLRERLLRLLDLPDPLRPLAELALAGAQLDYEQARRVIEAELTTVMDQPTDVHDVALRARFEAHRQLPDEARQEADRALDQAIGDALGAPQRIFVRDFLYSLGWERP
jgi:tetratricopeptide (TPR) repeat protein